MSHRVQDPPPFDSQRNFRSRRYLREIVGQHKSNAVSSETLPPYRPCQVVRKRAYVQELDSPGFNLIPHEETAVHVNVLLVCGKKRIRGEPGCSCCHRQKTTVLPIQQGWVDVRHLREDSFAACLIATFPDSVFGVSTPRCVIKNTKNTLLHTWQPPPTLNVNFPLSRAYSPSVYTSSLCPCISGP